MKCSATLELGIEVDSVFSRLSSQFFLLGVTSRWQIIFTEVKCPLVVLLEALLGCDLASVMICFKTNDCKVGTIVIYPNKIKIKQEHTAEVDDFSLKRAVFTCCVDTWSIINRPKCVGELVLLRGERQLTVVQKITMYNLYGDDKSILNKDRDSLCGFRDKPVTASQRPKAWLPS